MKFKKYINEAMVFTKSSPRKDNKMTKSVDSPKDFDKAIKMFLKGSQKQIDDNNKKNGYGKEKLGISPGGKKYLRVYINKIVDGKGDKLSKSAFCFIDKNNGDVLKAAGWKAPAKHSRGNIFDGSWGVNAVSVYGAKYMR